MEQKAKYKTYLLNNAEALYPRLNQPYRYDQNSGPKGGSVPCKATDPGAAYTMSFKISKKEAAKLAKAMKEVFEEKFPTEEMNFPFKKEEDGEHYIGKAKLAAAFGSSITKPPIQVDGKKQLLPSDFQLTTGSTVNLFFQLVPYNGTMGSGVSCRLRQLQVVQLAESTSNVVFDAIDADFEEVTDVFSDVSNATQNKSEEAQVEEVEELIEEPKVKPSKKNKAEPSGDVDLASLLDEYDD